MHLKHLLLSHHGQYEYGSPKRPKTMEAVILNFLDDLDSKINGVRTHIEREPDRESSWTQYHRLYDRYFFKGSSVKSDAAVAKTEPVGKQTEVQAQASVARSGNRPRFSNTLEEQLRARNTRPSQV